VIYLGWYSRAKKKAKKQYRKGFNRSPYGAYYNYNKRAYNSRFNQKNKLVGFTPDYMVSPIDLVPYVGAAKKAGKVRKYRKRTVRGVKAAYKSSQRSRPGRSSSPNRRTSQSRRGGSSRYYYYRGKRYERKYRR